MRDTYSIKAITGALNRREMIALTAAAPLFSIRARGRTTVPPLDATDAHVHLFNAADLPISGYAKYVLAPEWLQTIGWASAFIDFLGTFIKKHSVSVEKETDRSQRATADGLDVDQFAAQAAAFLETRRRPALVQSNPALAASYDQLHAGLMAAARGGARNAKARRSQPPGTPREATLAAVIAQSAREAEKGQPVAEVELTASPCDPPSIGLGGVRRAFGWAYLLAKGRDYHLRNYLNRSGGPQARMRTIVNHLVDYDFWLDDEPHSDPVALVALFDRIGRRAQAAGRIDALHTFAGFCPLKLAIQARQTGPMHFDALQQLFRDGAIRGFKLYPPMGFRPIGNAKLSDSCFCVPAGRRITPLDRWHKVSGGQPLGPAIDEALEALYAFCDRTGAPIMAHSRKSNESAPEFGVRAAPAGWAAVLDRYRVKLLLGHLIDGPGCFLDGLPGQLRDRSWELKASVALLNARPTHGGEVYGDLSYMPELAGNPALAARFFDGLRRAFGEAGLARVCFGSDWIMLAREPRNAHYLQTMVTGMQLASYRDDQIDGIVRGNAARWLMLPAATTARWQSGGELGRA